MYITSNIHARFSGCHGWITHALFISFCVPRCVEDSSNHELRVLLQTL
jgi:hypothetical protein